MTASTSDKEFAHDIGISFGNCEMCDLLAIDTLRKDAVIKDLRRSNARHQQYIAMWKLATFAATMMMIFFAWNGVK